MKYDIIPIVAKRKALPRNSVMRKIRILAKPVSIRTRPIPTNPNLSSSDSKATAMDARSPCGAIPQGKNAAIPR